MDDLTPETQAVASEMPTGVECYRRACDLLEQAFAEVPSGACNESRRPALGPAERDRYIAGAQAYAALAQVAATITPRYVGRDSRHWEGVR